MVADRHLLFGLLALQNGLIQQAQLVAAFHAWTCDKSRTLADHLVALGHLNAAQRAAVEALAALHVEAHGGDVERSLAVLAVLPDVRDRLEVVPDLDLQASLLYLGLTTDGGIARGEATASWDDAERLDTDGRFQIVRFHDRGAGRGLCRARPAASSHRRSQAHQVRSCH